MVIGSHLILMYMGLVRSICLLIAMLSCHPGWAQEIKSSDDFLDLFELLVLLSLLLNLE